MASKKFAATIESFIEGKPRFVILLAALIRDDKGYWTQVETYVANHTDANFTHGFCPECASKLYPEHYEDILGRNTEDK